MVEEKICNLLALGNGVLTVEVVKAALPSYSEAEICCALVALSVAERIAIDSRGVRLLAIEGHAAEDQINCKPEEAVGGDGGSVSPACETTDGTAPAASNDELLGDPEPRDYSDTFLPDEDIEAMLQSMGYVSPSDDSQPCDGGQEEQPSAPAPVEPPVESVGPLTFGGSLKRLPLKTRVANYCEREDVKTVGELLRELPVMEAAPGIGAGSVRSVREMLKASALLPTIPLDTDQLGALVALSGSPRLVFDLFGVLCWAQGSADVEEEAASADPYATMPVEALDLPETVWRALRANQVETVGQLLSMGLEGMRDLRFFGEKKVGLVRQALEAAVGEEVLAGPLQKAAVGLEEYLAAFSPEGRAVANRLIDKLVERGLPVFKEAALVTVLPEVEELVANCSRWEDRERSLENLAAALEADDHAVIACQAELRRRVRKMLKHASKGKVDAGFAVPSSAPWRKAAEEMLAAEPSLSFDEETQMLTVKVPTLMDWLGTLKESHQQALLLRLQGETLETVGSAMGVTRERVRQITVKALDRRPALAEDAYRAFFDTYAMTKEQFVAATGVSDEVYEYLDLTKPKDGERLPLEAALEDDALDEGLKEAVRDIVDEGFTYIDGVRTPLRRKPVIEALLRKHTQEQCISLGELLELYRAFIDEHDMEDEGVFQGSGPRALDASLDRWDFSMQSSVPTDDDGVRRDIRYFAWEEKDFEPLLRALEEFSRGRCIECSTAILMRDPAIAAVAESLDIRNEYELHCVMRRGLPQVEFMTLGKRPMVTFGDADRNGQVLALIQEIGPVDAYELAQAYEERYGVAEATFRGSFLKDFGAYESQGKYVCVDAELTAAQKDYLSVLLGAQSYVPLAYVRDKYRTAFPGAPIALVNNRSLQGLNYGISGSLVVRCDANLSEIFGGIMDSRDVFGATDEDLGLDVVRHEAFKSELNKRIRAFEVVEYEPDKYVRTCALARSASVTPEDLRSFADAAIEFMEPERPYSVRSLRRAGFDHPLFRLEDVFDIANDHFFGSLIATGYVGNRVKISSCCNVQLFCRKTCSLSAPDLIAYEVTQLASPRLEDLRDRLADEHGLTVDRSFLRMLAKRAGVDLLEDNDLAEEEEAGSTIGDGESFSDAESASGPHGGGLSSPVEAIDFFASGEDW